MGQAGLFEPSRAINGLGEQGGIAESSLSSGRCFTGDDPDRSCSFESRAPASSGPDALVGRFAAGSSHIVRTCCMQACEAAARADSVGARRAQNRGTSWWCVGV